MPRPQQTRRTVLKTIGAGLVAGAISVPASANDDEGPDKLSRELNTVRDATQQYKDVETAREDGYEDISPYVPGMGFHFSDRTPPFGTVHENPPVLVYFTNGSYNPNPGDPHDSPHDDDLILGAAEFLVGGNQEDDPPDIFHDEDSPRNLKTTEEEGWHYESEENFTGLHAWVHRGNPAGVFHPTNPNID